MRLLVDTLSSMKELEKTYVFWFGNGFWVDQGETLGSSRFGFKTLFFRLSNSESKYQPSWECCVYFLFFFSGLVRCRWSSVLEFYLVSPLAR